MRAPAALVAAIALLVALACDDARRADSRRAEVERRAAEAERGGPAPAASPGPHAITGEPAAQSPSPAEPTSPAVAAWAASIAGAIDGVGRRSAQMLTVHLLRAARDPRQKSQELIAYLQWCDEGSLDACLHAGHVLLFNECLFDRARGFYEKARSLADGLPAAAIDPFTVDGQPQRTELGLGLRFSDPANRDDEQVRAVAAVCGAVAERDRALWDEMFARYAAGDVTEAASASTGQERVALGAVRKKMLIEIEERVAALERSNAGAARPLRARLAAAAHDLCGDADPVSCATAAFLHSGRCELAQMEDAYRRFQSALPSLDTASQAQALDLARDILGPARGYVDGDEKTRDLIRRSLCDGSRATSP